VRLGSRSLVVDFYQPNLDSPLPLERERHPFPIEIIEVSRNLMEVHQIDDAKGMKVNQDIAIDVSDAVGSNFDKFAAVCHREEVTGRSLLPIEARVPARSTFSPVTPLIVLNCASPECTRRWERWRVNQKINGKG